ncbi:hypothetical protein VTN00DRAFT_6400 [Thermoascus crustaceus]|uniref:uncharacterized protein n=1 Tax=Thermoascus crustaceus TaxID=5088 RepID=UPI0037431BD1
MPTHPDRYRLSSSLPLHQSWPHLSPSYPSPAAAATPVSSQTQTRPPRHCEHPAIDESILARRTTAFRQLNGSHKPLSRKHRQSKSSGSRSSTLASQPVLVRAYNAETDETAPSSTNMPHRRFSLASGSQQQQPAPELPSVQDFSIEGILRAIEPDIRSTLDQIAEICGRSKLSLSNEYGSHIAPLGEIRAPPGGLLTVEEASSSNERLVDDSVVIVDDDTSFLDGRDHYRTSSYGLLDHLRQAAQAMGYQGDMPDGSSMSMQVQPDTPRSAVVPNPMLDIDAGARPFPTTKEFTSKSKAGSRALLGQNGETAHGSARDQLQSIVTPAVVSEIHLDARADESSRPSVPPDSPQASPTSLTPRETAYPIGGSSFPLPSRADRFAFLSDLQNLLSWLKGAAGAAQRGSRKGKSRQPPPQSAETRLRAMLERQNAHLITTNERGVAVHAA